MFTCRKELEEILGLKHPRRVVIEESGEIPRQADRFFRGIYLEPEKLKRSFSDLQKETVSLLEMLTPRRNRFREWYEELPNSPTDAKEYIRETAVELKVRHEKAALAEARVLSLLQEQNTVELFPIDEELLAKWSPERIILFSRVIERLASLIKVSFDVLNKVVLVHMMTHVLVYAGEDRDKKIWSRQESTGEGLEALIHYYSNCFYQGYDYKELAQGDLVLQRFLPATGRDSKELSGYSREQIASALIFWRRRQELGLREVLGYLSDFV